MSLYYPFSYNNLPLILLVHLSLSGVGTDAMGLDYVSDIEGSSVVEYGPLGDSGTDSSLRATSQYTFISSIGYLHNVELGSLQAEVPYKYRIGDGSGENWSAWFNFTNGPYQRADFIRKSDSNTDTAQGVAAIYADLVIAHFILFFF